MNTGKTLTSTSHGPKKINPVTCGSFEKDKLLCTRIEENERAKNQYMSYLRYKSNTGAESNFLFSTDEIKLTQYGIPRLTKENEQYYPNDRDRCFIKVPFDPSQDGCNKLRQHCYDVDAAIDNSQMRLTIFGEKRIADNYQYLPIVKKPVVLGDMLISAKKKPVQEQKERFEYCKIKFDVDFDTGFIKTAVFKKDPDTGEITRERVKTISDLEEIVRYGSTIRMIVLVNKLWASKAPVSGSYKFGVSLKVVQMEVVPGAVGKSIRDEFTDYAFGPAPVTTKDDSNEKAEDDSDDDKDSTVENGESDDEDSDENVSEPEPEPEPPKKGGKAKSAPKKEATPKGKSGKSKK